MPSLFSSFTHSNLIKLQNKKDKSLLYKILEQEQENDKIINIHEDHFEEIHEHQFGLDSGSKCPMMSFRSKDHAYVKRSLGSPCPGISILINHSYLNPKDENDPIPFYKLIYALVKCFNLSWINSIFLTFLANFILGNFWYLRIKDLGKHGYIEHDASLSRFDSNQGDNSNPNDNRLNKLFNLSISNKDEKNEKITLKEFSKTRKSIEFDSSKYRPMTNRGKFTGMGEIGLILSVFGQNSSFESGQEPYIRKSWMKTIFIEERLPDEWCRPSKPVSILKVYWFIKALKQLMI